MLRMIGSNSGDFVCTQVLHNLWKLFLFKKYTLKQEKLRQQREGNNDDADASRGFPAAQRRRAQSIHNSLLNEVSSEDCEDIKQPQPQPQKRKSTKVSAIRKFFNEQRHSKAAPLVAVRAKPVRGLVRATTISSTQAKHMRRDLERKPKARVNISGMTVDVAAADRGEGPMSPGLSFTALKRFSRAKPVLGKSVEKTSS